MSAANVRCMHQQRGRGRETKRECELGKWTDRQTDMDRRYSQTDRQLERHTAKQTDRQTDKTRHTDKQVDPRERQTDT